MHTLYGQRVPLAQRCDGECGEEAALSLQGTWPDLHPVPGHSLAKASVFQALVILRKPPFSLNFHQE